MFLKKTSGRLSTEKPFFSISINIHLYSTLQQPENDQSASQIPYNTRQQQKGEPQLQGKASPNKSVFNLALN